MLCSELVAVVVVEVIVVIGQLLQPLMLLLVSLLLVGFTFLLVVDMARTGVAMMGVVVTAIVVIFCLFRVAIKTNPGGREEQSGASCERGESRSQTGSDGKKTSRQVERICTAGGFDKDRMAVPELYTVKGQVAIREVESEWSEEG
jgi:hypothetical protein